MFNKSTNKFGPVVGYYPLSIPELEFADKTKTIRGTNFFIY